MQKQCFHHGTMKVTLNHQLQIELLEFNVSEHQELVQRLSLKPVSSPNDSPDAKESPRKVLGKRQRPTVNLPESCVNHYGLAPMVIRFLEVRVEESPVLIYES